MSNPLIKNTERIDDLIKGGLKIIQNDSAPRFAVDAIILADFVAAKQQKSLRIADLGTGTGILSLLLSDKFSSAHISAFEIMPQMADMASRSVELNNLQDRIKVYEADLKTAPALLGAGSMDLIISNPPYFKANSGRENKSEVYTAARSELYCTATDLFAVSFNLLKPQGSLFLIHRSSRAGEIIGGLEASGLHVECLRAVQPKKESPSNLFMVKARRQGNGETIFMPPLIIYNDDGSYSEEMERIYGRNPVSGVNSNR